MCLIAKQGGRLLFIRNSRREFSEAMLLLAGFGRSTKNGIPPQVYLAHPTLRMVFAEEKT